ncbi:unnamed protein product [Darwinula stevensoni]|uniref:Uncharacterized protein n=1 Tax=Darwinula stevensoni TaxID=69355 RepID=A0A7R9AA19_9CRUS|nr:unnamed protein product [Darwinula stevensoni]CAG0897893.1 unnamed protein product [Darwinula stevensoni]
MWKKFSIASVVYDRKANIQFEDNGETVGVGPVTVKFLQRFSGHGLGRAAYTDSSRFRKTIWLLVFIIASGYMVRGIVGVFTAFLSGVMTTSNQDGLQLILTPHVWSQNNLYFANGFHLQIHSPGAEYESIFGKEYKVNLGTISHVTPKKVVLQRLPPEEGGHCAPASYLEKRFDLNMFNLKTKYEYTNQFVTLNFLNRENLAVVNVYYETFAVERISEHLQYPWSSFIGTLGGMLGLYTGLSFISILEVMEWILNIFLYGWRKPRP